MPFDLGINLIHRDALETFIVPAGGIAMVIGRQAGGTGKIRIQDLGIFPQRRIEPRGLRPEKNKIFYARQGSKMSRAAVIGDQEIGDTEQVHQFSKGGLAGELDTSGLVQGLMHSLGGFPIGPGPY